MKTYERKRKTTITHLFNVYEFQAQNGKSELNVILLVCCCVCFLFSLFFFLFIIIIALCSIRLFSLFLYLSRFSFSSVSLHFFFLPASLPVPSSERVCSAQRAKGDDGMRHHPVNNNVTHATNGDVLVGAQCSSSSSFFVGLFSFLTATDCLPPPPLLPLHMCLRFEREI